MRLPRGVSNFQTWPRKGQRGVHRDGCGRRAEGVVAVHHPEVPVEERDHDPILLRLLGQLADGSRSRGCRHPTRSASRARGFRRRPRRAQRCCRPRASCRPGGLNPRRQARARCRRRPVSDPASRRDGRRRCQPDKGARVAERHPADAFAGKSIVGIIAFHLCNRRAAPRPRRRRCARPEGHDAGSLNIKRAERLVDTATFLFAVVIAKCPNSGERGATIWGGYGALISGVQSLGIGSAASATPDRHPPGMPNASDEISGAPARLDRASDRDPRIVQLGHLAPNCSCRHRRPRPSHKWSDPASWPSHAVPVLNEDVIVPAGEPMLLDVSPPRAQEPRDSRHADLRGFRSRALRQLHPGEGRAADRNGGASRTRIARRSRSRATSRTSRCSACRARRFR